MLKHAATVTNTPATLCKTSLFQQRRSCQPLSRDLAFVVVAWLILLVVVQRYAPILTFPLKGGRDNTRRTLFGLCSR